MDTLTLDSICIPSNDVISREIEGELIIVLIESGIGKKEDELFTLNETGIAIWKRFDGKRSLWDIADDISGIYNAHIDQITRDVLGLAKELLRRKILVCRR